MGFSVRRAGWGLAACVFYRPCMVDTMEKRRRQSVWKKRRRLYVLRKTQAGKSGEKEQADTGARGNSREN